MNSTLRRPLVLFASFALVFGVSACGDDDSADFDLGNQLPVTVTTDIANVESGKPVVVTAESAPGGSPLSYAWSASGGRFSDPTAASTTWTAPEEAGVFTLNCVVSDDVGAGIGGADVTVTLYTPMDTPFYRGAEVCAGCHAQEGAPGGDQYNPWSESQHAEAIDALARIGQDENDYCLGCHTVGTNGLYADPMLDNGGYDDTAVVRLQNVQCENCHGPASDHPSPDFGSVGVALEAEVCGDCHNGPHHPTFEEWQLSGHSMPVEFAAARADCAGCHNGLEGPRYLDDPEGYTPLPDDPTEIVAHTCATCHDPHGNDNPGNLRDASVNDVPLPGSIYQPAGGAGKLCMSCHNGRRSGEDVDDQVANGASRFGPHHSVQGDMLSAVNAYEDVAPEFPFSSSLHINVEDACVTCHTSPNDGDPENGIPEFTGHTFEPTVEACQPCHGDIGDFDDILAKSDFDGNGTIDGVQTEIQGLLDILEQTIIDASQTPEAMMALEEDFEGNLGDPMITTPEQRAAGYNWTFVAYDGSTGVHNAVYSIQLLQQSTLSLDPGAFDASAVVLESD